MNAITGVVKQRRMTAAVATETVQVISGDS
jgi:hypothetical protein